MRLNEVFTSYYNNGTNLYFNIEENFNFYKISVLSDSLPNLDLSLFSFIEDFISARDKLNTISIVFDDLDPIILYEDKYIDFIDEINNTRDVISEYHNLSFTISISKHLEDNILSMYDLDAFSCYLKTLSLSELVHSFYISTNRKFIYLEVQIFDEDFVSYSNLFCIKTKGLHIERTFCYCCDDIDKRDGICNLLNDEKFNFQPNDFSFTNTINEDLDEIFNRLKIVYSLISIFNFSSIKDNFIEIRINGYKSSNFTINFTDIDIAKTITYYEIYKWIYCEGTLADKIEIARNIISLYLMKSENIFIDLSALTSIQSNYNIYLKENVEKYLDLKTKVIESMLSISASLNELSNSITDAFIKNLGAIGTFIITIIIMNSFSEKKLSNIFTKDITVLSLGLIFISILFLIYTTHETNSKLKNLIILYSRLKNSYKDLLAKKDIENLFKKDRFFKKDIKNIKRKINKYILLWILVLCIFLGVLFVLGFQYFSIVYYKIMH